MLFGNSIGLRRSFAQWLKTRANEANARDRAHGRSHARSGSKQRSRPEVLSRRVPCDASMSRRTKPLTDSTQVTFQSSIALTTEARSASKRTRNRSRAWASGVRTTRQGEDDPAGRTSSRRSSSDSPKARERSRRVLGRGDSDDALHPDFLIGPDDPAPVDTSRVSGPPLTTEVPRTCGGRSGGR